MKNRFFTVMILPEKTSRVRKLIIPSLFIKVVLGVFLVITIAMVFIIYDYVGLKREILEAGKVKDENTVLLSKIEHLQNGMLALNNSLDRINLFVTKLKGITRFKGSEEDIPINHSAIGPITAKEMTAHDRDIILSELNDPQLLVSTPKDISRLDKQLRILKAKTRFQDESIHELKNYLDDQATLLSSTPAIWPTRGWITSNFGYRTSTLNGSRGLHKGIDIATRVGTTVRAAADGVVIEAGYRSDYGKVIVVNHGYNHSTLYGHNSQLMVKSGDRVKRGQKIAKAGSTGRSTGSHLHYEVRVNGVAVNPKNYLLN